MKRFLAIILALTMIFAFASCGVEKAKRKSKKETKKEEVVTLTWYAIGDAQPDIDEVLEAANEIIESEINANLELNFIPSSAYDQKMKMIIAAGEEFDICFTSNWKNDYSTTAELGGLCDITDLISDDLYDIMDDKYWEDMKIDGRIYAVPNMQVMYTQLAVGVRADLADEYNIDLSDVEHIEDIEPVLEVLHENEPNIYTYNNRWGVSPWIYDTYTDVSGGNGIYARKDNGEIVNSLDTQEYNRAVDKLRQWYQKGYIRQDYASANYDNNVVDINQGKYAVKIETYNPGRVETGTYEYVYKSITDSHFAGARSSALAVGALSENPEKALELIKLVNTNKELYNILCYGIEDEHYTLNGEGKVVTKTGSGYNPGNSWQFGNQFNAILTEGMPDDTWELTKRLNDEARVSVPTGFNFVKDDIYVEFANITAVNDEYSDFVTVSDYNAYLNDRKSALELAGIGRLTQEIEKQMKAHIKSR